jgi:hypothetical protein
MLEVSRDAVTAGEEQLISCAAEQSKYCCICTVNLDPCGDLPSRVGVVGSVFAAALTVRTAAMPLANAELNIGVGPCWGEACGDMLEAIARITPSQPNDAMAHIASRRNRTISLDPNLPGHNSEIGSLKVDSKLFSKVQTDSKEDWAKIRGKITRRHHHHSVNQNAQFYVQPSGDFADPPCSAASFEVNSEPHIGARPSVRLCVGLKTGKPLLKKLHMTHHHLVVFIQHDPGELRGL